MVDRRIMTRGGVECVLNGAVVEKLASDLRGDLIATDDRDYDVAKSGSQWTRRWREVDSNPRSPARGSMVVDTATAMSGWQLLPGCGSLSRAAGRDRSIASSLRIIVSIFWVRRKKRTQINVQ
jgi:hypothetical protein